MTQRDLTQRYLLTVLGLLFLASVGAFLLYVPMMSVIVVTMIMMGMISMFVLGFMARKPRTYGRAKPAWSILPAKIPEAKILPWPAVEPGLEPRLKSH